MKNARTRALAATAVAALFLSPLAACGSDAKDNAGAKPSASAGSDTGDSSSTGTSSGASADRLTRANFADVMLKGVQDKKSAHISMKVGTALDAQGDVRYDGDDSEMKMTMTAGGQDMKMVFVDDVLYMQMPGMAQPGKWTKVDSSTPGLGGLVGQMKTMGPAGSLEMMKKGLKDVEYVGEDTIDGQKVSKYHVTADTRAAADAMGLGKQSASLPAETSYDLYVDKDNLMRRVVVEVMSQKLVLDVTDWGKAVDVEAPPASDVVEMPMTSSTQ